MKTRLLQIWATLRSRLKFNRQFWVYVLCLVVSCAFWVLTTLSKDYTTTLYFPINYTDLPDDKIVAAHLPERLAVEVNSFGFNLLWYKIGGGSSSIDLRAGLEHMRSTGKAGKYFIATSTKISEVSRQLDNELSIKSLRPDTIFFEFSDKVSKEVPVKIVSDLTFEKQFQLSGSMNAQPAKVMISGPASIIDTIKAVFTDVLAFQNLAQSIEKEVLLKKPDLPNVDLSESKVKVTVPVEKFTEGRTEVGVSVMNLPEGHKMKLFPEKVEVVYLVPLSRFEEAANIAFSAYVDYAGAKGNSQKLKVNVKDAPAYVSSLRVAPETVEYIIQK